MADHVDGTGNQDAALRGVKREREEDDSAQAAAVAAKVEAEDPMGNFAPIAAPEAGGGLVDSAGGPGITAAMPVDENDLPVDDEERATIMDQV